MSDLLCFPESCAACGSDLSDSADEPEVMIRGATFHALCGAHRALALLEGQTFYPENISPEDFSDIIQVLDVVVTLARLRRQQTENRARDLAADGRDRLRQVKDDA